MPIKIPTATIEIQEKVAGRLSPDLAELCAPDETFGWRVDKKKKKLILDGASKDSNRLKMWGSNEKARSGWIGLKSILKRLGFDNPEELIGQTFDCTVHGQKIEIQF